MNSTGRLTQKGSTDAAEYAQKRQAQMERARQMREERKNGVGSSSSSSVFKNVGHESLHRAASTNSRSAQQTQMSGVNVQDTTATSMMSSPGQRYDPFMNSNQMPNQGPPPQRHYSQMAYQQQQQQQQQNTGYNGGFQNQSQPQHYGNENFQNPHQMDAFAQPLNAGGAVGNFGGPQAPQMNQNFGMPQPNMHSDGFMRNSSNNFSMQGGHMGGGQQREGMIVNNHNPGSHTQDNYYPQMQRNRSVNAYQPSQMLSPQSYDDGRQQLPPRHQNFGGAPGQLVHPGQQQPMPVGMHTISHEGGYNGGFQRQHTHTGFSQNNNLQTQQDFGAFRSAQSTQYPGHLTPNRQTHYSQRDVEEARGSLTLLKKRMSNSRDRQSKNATIEYASSSNQQNMSAQDPRSQRNGYKQSTPNVMNQSIGGGGGGGHVPPRPPRVNQSQVYNDSSLADSVNGTLGDNRGNYRKVFKPNIPGGAGVARSDVGGQLETNSNDSVERANAMALGLTPKSASRKPPMMNHSSGGMNPPSYEPERRQANPRSGGASAYQRGSAPMNADNQVLQSSPSKRGRVGLPPTSRGAMNKPRQSEQRFEPPPMEDPYYQEEMKRPEPTSYNFDDNMADPFGQKQGGGVQNTPPKSNPLAGGGAGGLQQKSNFHDELAQNTTAVSEQPEMGAQLIQCDTCERKFNAKALERHSKVCVKVFQTKRKAFDVAEQRKATDASGKGVEEHGGGGLSNYKPKMPGRKAGGAGARSSAAANAASAKKEPGKMPKWKIQSMQFRQAVGPIKPQGGGGAASNFNPSFEASEPADDRVLCEFCGRKFAEKTAERHIPHCETKYKANLMKNGPPKASGRPAQRRAPSYGGRR